MKPIEGFGEGRVVNFHAHPGFSAGDVQFYLYAYLSELHGVNYLASCNLIIEGRHSVKHQVI